MGGWRGKGGQKDILVGAENSPSEAERGAYSGSSVCSPLLKLPRRENYSEKWHIKRLSHSTCSTDINNCLSNCVQTAPGGDAGVQAD